MGDQSSTRPTLRQKQSVNRYREANVSPAGSSSLETTQPPKPAAAVPLPRCSRIQIVSDPQQQACDHDRYRTASRTSSAKSMPSTAPEIVRKLSHKPRSDPAMHTLLEYRAGKLHRPTDAAVSAVDKNKAGKPTFVDVKDSVPNDCHFSGNPALKGPEFGPKSGVQVEPTPRDGRSCQVAIHNGIHCSCFAESRIDDKAMLVDSSQKIHLSVHSGNGTDVDVPYRNGVGEMQAKLPATFSPTKTADGHDVWKDVGGGHTNGYAVAPRNRSMPRDCPHPPQHCRFGCEKNVGSDYLNGTGSLKDGSGATNVTHHNGCGQDSIDSNLSSSSGSSSTSSRQWQEISALKLDNCVRYDNEDDDYDDDDDSGFFLQENDFDEDTFDDSSSLEASFAGRRNYLMPERVICGETGTIRGMKNRVRAGIETFHQQTDGKKNFHHLETSKVVVYTTTNGIVRETFQKCLKVKMILSTLLVPFEERDIFKYRGYQRELAERLNANQITIPQVFIAGDYLGDSKIIEDLNELGRLRKILRPYKRPGSHVPCQKCGGYKLIICSACNGSKKSVHRNRFTENSIPLRCSKCDECGLSRCDLCCIKTDRDVIIN